MAKLPESKERRLQGLNQDVLAVATPVPGPDLEPVKLRPQKKNKPVSVSEGGHSGLLWLSLVLAVIALLLAASQWLTNSETSRELSELRQQYYQLASERQGQEEARSVEKAPAPASTEAAPGNAVVTSLRDDLRELNAKVRGLTVALAKQRNSSQESDELATRLDDMDSRLKGLSSRISSLADRPQPAATPVAQPASDNSAEVSALAGKVAKIDKDLQALYRILQGG
tara:strand:- start:47 stop:727 length:681 start_codon:yes stop_codon:yes gene_type:complete